jgi:steroid 5-alpha reductase family enzyme
MSEYLIFLIWGIATTFLLFTVAWVIQLSTKNAAIADVAWAFAFPILTLVYFFIAGNTVVRNITILLLTFCWGTRLGIYLFVRSIGKPEDGRYTSLRKKWGEKQNVLMLRFYYFQAFAALILSLPFALLMHSNKTEIGIFEISGIALWLIGTLGETIADAQLSKFKAIPDHKNKICTRGLWHYSRHPNYFFEWLIWVGFFVMALGVPWGITAIISPLVMWCLLTKLTGIGYTEKHMLKTRGRSFAEYQRTTSAFIPLPKRNISIS